MNRVFRSALWLLFSCCAIANTDSKPPKVKDGAPQTYSVVKGDTLWDISAMYLHNPWLWPRLWQVNPIIENPHLIYPGDKLSLMWSSGQPVLSVKPVKKLSPKTRIINRQDLPTVARELVMPYLNSDRLVDDKTLDNAAKVVGSSKGNKFLTAQDTLYISGEQTSLGWAIYRPVETFSRDDIAQQVTALRLIAHGELVEVSSEFSGLKITSQRQEIIGNDIALPMPASGSGDFSATFYPMPSPHGSSAKLLGEY